MEFDSPPSDPIPACQTWFDEARERCTVPNTNAMALSTVGKNGQPSCRMVLLKGFDHRGPVFYTNSQSRKGNELEAMSKASLLFFWDELERQIRFEGTVEHVSCEEADAYFASRPRGSRIGAWASEQSRPCADRATLDAGIEAVEKRFEGQDVPRPPHWLGYRVIPDRIEFWQGGESRVHDRVVYDLRDDGSWDTQRLWP
tara:strand:+ start:136 stop:735 length:600 start_codon:yes stop_codon:yes gene_type:complete